jgi:transposase
VDRLGLRVNLQQVFPEYSILYCRPLEADACCPGCGQEGRVHDYVDRRLAHLPLGRKATWLQVRTPRYCCVSCGRTWRHGLKAAARPRCRLSRSAQFWALSQVVLDHTSIASVARLLGVSWDTANDAVASLGQQLLISDEHRFEGVTTIGVDEHCWRHTRKGDKYVTVIIDLSPLREHRGPARLLDMIEGRSKKGVQSLAE